MKTPGLQTIRIRVPCAKSRAFVPAPVSQLLLFVLFAAKRLPSSLRLCVRMTHHLRIFSATDKPRWAISQIVVSRFLEFRGSPGPIVRTRSGRHEQRPSTGRNYSNSASTNSSGSNSSKSSSLSPTPTYLTGMPICWRIATTIPPFAVPSNLARMMPVQ